MRPWFRPLVGVLLAIGFAAPASVAAAAVNHPPAVASKLELDGSACNGLPLGASAREPELSFTATDPDGDAVSAKVEYWGTGIASYAHRKSFPIAATMSGFDSGDVPLPMKDGWLNPANKDGKGSYGLRVMTYDAHGLAAKAWSATCKFTLDVKAPSAPKLTGPKLSGPWQLDATHTVVARPGGDPSDTATYEWALDTGCEASVTGPYEKAVGKDHHLDISLTPTTYAIHTLCVWAFDATGNMSSAAMYQFTVLDSFGVWEYSFDDVSGAAVPDDGDATPKVPMTLSNSALVQLRGRWNSGRAFLSDNMLDVGQGQTGRGTAALSLKPSGSFTIAAWLDPVIDAKNPKAMTAVAYGDSATPWVKLGIDKTGHDSLSVYDATSKSYHSVTTKSVDDGSLGFQFVVGSYNAVTKRLEISVTPDGSTWDTVAQNSKAAATTLPATFANGHLEVGDGSWKASAAENWVGRIDQVDVAQGMVDPGYRNVLYSDGGDRGYICGVVEGKAPCA